MASQITPSSSDRAILTYWKLPRPHGQTLACTSYRTTTGLELRAGVDGEPLVLHSKVMTHAEAQQLAGLWRQQLTRSAAA
jgi:hypothetical protein